MPEAVEITMDTIITTATPMIEFIWAQAIVVATTIVSSPLMFLTVCFLIAGGIVGIFGRLLSRN